MNLLKMRFEDSLEYELKVVNPDPEAKVVPLSLQLLLRTQNIMISSKNPLQIRIYIEMAFSIQNDYQKKRSYKIGKVGLHIGYAQ
jgi:hypothetical protein